MTKDDETAPDTHSSSCFRWLGKLRLGMIGAVVMAFSMLALYLTYLFGMPDIYFWKSPGRIFVESPEVYTRERLVNDRYLQASWLNAKLSEVDSAPFQARRVTSRISGSTGDGANVEKKSQAENEREPQSGDVGDGTLVVAQAQQDNTQRFPFDVEYELKAAMRDKIRQDIIENMLDDRHDLTGNSLVALKFDTTVLKRKGSRYNAKISFKVTTEQLVTGTAQDKAADGNQTALKDLNIVEAFYLGNEGMGLFSSGKNVLGRSYQKFERWIKNIEYRLDRELRRACERSTSPKAQASANQMFHDALRKVLSVQNGGVFVNAQQKTIPLPLPWADIFSLSYSSNITEDGNCSSVNLSVSPLAPIVYIFQTKEKGRADEFYNSVADIRSNYTIVLSTLDGRIHFTDKASTSSNVATIHSIGRISGEIFSIFEKNNVKSHLYTRNAGEVCLPPIDKMPDSTVAQDSAGTSDYICKNDTVPRNDKEITEATSVPIGQTAPRDNKETIDTVSVPAGYFNFMRRVQGADSYLYSLIPSGSSTARVLSKSAKLRLGMPSAIENNATLEHAQDLTVFDTEPKVLTFGSVGPHKDDPATADAIEFGWIAFNDQDRAGPETFSQTALISVPAWADEIKAEVSTSWIDDAGNPIFEDQPRTFSIPMPSDYEIFDASLSDTASYRRPSIDKQLMLGENIGLRNGQRGSIIIPGARLWRSTVVTLGSQRADEIFVLPDMEGVIATFDPIAVHFKEEECPIAVLPSVDKGQPAEATTPKTTPLSTRLCKKNLTLRVWTSEGMDYLENKIMVFDNGYDGENAKKIGASSGAAALQ
jgi:hypothetical protein